MKKHKSPILAVDVIIFTIDKNKLKTLLINRTNEPFINCWALPGGFLHDNETTIKAADRILKEKAGIQDVYIEQLYTFDKPGRDPRGQIISVTYFALVPFSDIVIVPGKNLQSPELFDIGKLPELAFDHKSIIAYAHKRLSAKIEYTNAIRCLLPKEFTLSQLQKSYEAIMAKRIDKRNFRKKYLSLKLIRATGKYSSGGRQRPARLYCFIAQKPTELKKFI